MKAVPGVTAVMSGYTGGTLPNPTYQDVITEKTGHYESVRVTFDPAKISYAQLLDRYFPLVDATDNGGQFCDRGPSYRPAIFATPEQKPIAEAARAKWATRLKSGKMIVPVLPAAKFYEAEAYHRNYAETNKLQYNLYRAGCGRDARLVRVWGRRPGG